MERIFIETKYQGKIEIPEKVIQQLPSSLVLAMAVQMIGHKEVIKKQLEKQGKTISFFKSRHGQYLGQVLGCDVFNFKTTTKAFFYVGDGKFHPTALLYGNSLPVYCYNPFTEQLTTITKKDIEQIKKKRQGQLAKFLNSDVIGLLTTTKSGQNQSKRAEEWREKLEKEGKEVFVFLVEEINFSSLENFNFIQSWVNTACPRIVEDFNCLNLEDLNY